MKKAILTAVVLLFTFMTIDAVILASKANSKSIAQKVNNPLAVTLKKM